MKTTHCLIKFHRRLPDGDSSEVRKAVARISRDIDFHNHFSFDKHFGPQLYRHQLSHVQYYIVDGCLLVVGLGQAAEKVAQLRFSGIMIDNNFYRAVRFHVERKEHAIAVSDKPISYVFMSPWMPLSRSSRYRKWLRSNDKQRKDLLNQTLREHLNVLTEVVDGKSLDFWVDIKRFVDGSVIYKDTRFVGIKGAFLSNLVLPDFVGIGRLTSAGYGAICKKSVASRSAIEALCL